MDLWTVTKAQHVLCYNTTAVLFDIMYAKTGTEAVAESFYRVVEQQEMGGKQSLEILSQRSKVDWCFPYTIQCEDALQEMAQIYIEGNSTVGMKRHYVPVYSDKRSRKRHLNEASKVISRITGLEVKLPFLL